MPDVQNIVIKNVRLKVGSQEAWEDVNPILLRGQPGYEIDTYRHKVGDGTTPWNDLPYLSGFTPSVREALENIAGGGGSTPGTGSGLTDVTGDDLINAVLSGTELTIAAKQALRDSLAKADTALQPAGLADYAKTAEVATAITTHNASEDAHAFIQNRIDSLEGLGHAVGDFDTLADVPTNTSGFTFITINDFVSVEDEGHYYKASVIDPDTGGITWVKGIKFSTDVTGKIDKVAGLAKAGTLPKLKLDGSLEDSDIPAEDVATQDYVDGAVYYVNVPDMANIESTNYISTNNGTWTVDRDGFVRLYGAGSIVRLLVDGEQIGTGSGLLLETVPVKAGSVVQITVDAGFGGASCFYVPPVKIPAPTAMGALTPDYTNIDPVSHITTSGGTWTVEADGYVLCRCGKTQNNNPPSPYISINNILITPDPGGTGGASSGIGNYPTHIFAVAKGDVVKMVGLAGGSGNALDQGAYFGCWYIPPRAILAGVTEVDGDGYIEAQLTASKLALTATQSMKDSLALADSIDGLIPTQASATNQLADKNFVNSTMQSSAANYVTYDAVGNAFPTLDALRNATTVYHGGAPYTQLAKDYCVDGDTEVLTDQGFIRFEEYEEGLPVCSYDPKTWSVAFEVPSRLVVSQGAEHKIGMKVTGSGEEVYCNEGHRVPLHWFNQRVIKYPSGTESTRHDEIQTRTALEWLNRSLDCRHLISTAKREADSSLSNDERLYLVLQADGCLLYYSKQCKHSMYRVNLKKERKIERLLALLESGCPSVKEYCVKESKFGFKSIYIKAVIDHDVKDLYDCFDVTSIGTEKAKAILEEASHWDGYIGDVCIHYSSCVRRNVDFMQYMAFIAGHNCTHIYTEERHEENQRDAYTLYVATTATTSNVKLKFTDYGATDDTFYCVTVSTGMFVCRKHGKMFVTGNCVVASDTEAPAPYTNGQTRRTWDGAVWAYSFGINERPFTAAESAALASGITKALTDKVAILPASEYMMTPDYANQETTNRITANNGTWIADRSGYVVCSLNISPTSAYGIIVVNEKTVSAGYGYVIDTVPVEVGDVVRIGYSSGSATLSCYFIPPKAIEPLFKVFTDKGMIPTIADLPTVANNFDMYYILAEQKDVYARYVEGVLTWVDVRSVNQVLMGGSPDWSNMDAVNHASTAGWTVERDGWVAVAYNSTGPAIYFYINGKQLAYANGSAGNYWAIINGCYPVHKGDIVRQSTGGGYVYFVPPFPPSGTVAGLPSLVNDGTEELTGDTLAGKPVYSMRINGTLGTDESTDHIFANIPGLTSVLKKYSQIDVGDGILRDSWTLPKSANPNMWDISVNPSTGDIIDYWYGDPTYSGAECVVLIEYVK